MLFSDHMKDRYCQFTCNQTTGQFERDWIRYADGVYEPVRREGSLSAKWNDRHERCLWWHERKPADWRPWDDGFGFSWNHTLGEKNKPAGYGNKSEAEAAAGNAPYFMEIEPGADGRIASRTERIDGRRETWRFSYDGEGRLTSCLANNGWAQDFEYDEQGRRAADYAVGRQPFKRAFAYDDADRLLSVGNVAYEHDAQGFRSARIDGEAITRYHYAPDYRLLGAELPDGRIIEMEHNDNGQRIIKLVNGTPVEAYRWRDFVRLAGFLDGECEQEFLYADDSRLPYAVRINDTTLTLEYDQIGSLKAVVDETGNVVKAIQYDPFGTLLWDSNPGLRIPLGFGGGLSDPNLGLVRFGWRDYDPDTGRWTAQDPIGDAGGDTDWYGYCLDDPINGVDPAGLFAWVIPLLGGLGAATGIAGLGTLGAGLAADGAGAVAGKNTDDRLKATKGAMAGYGGAALVNTGIAAGAAGAAAAAEAAPAIAATAPSLIRQGANAARTIGDKAKDAAKAGADLVRAHPDKVDKAARIIKDVVDPNMPPETVEGHVYSATKEYGGRAYDIYKTRQNNKGKNLESEESRQTHSGWRGR